MPATICLQSGQEQVTKLDSAGPQKQETKSDGTKSLTPRSYTDENGVMV
jgi:hypothetical protein